MTDNNWSGYSSSSVIVIYDYHDHSSAGGETNKIGGVNTSGEKVCLVNAAASFGGNIHNRETAAAHEIGHVVGCVHDDVMYENCSGFKTGSYMHTTQQQDTCNNVCNDDNVSAIRDEYSLCAENSFQT